MPARRPASPVDASDPTSGSDSGSATAGSGSGSGSWRREPDTVVRRAGRIPDGTAEGSVIRAESEVPDAPLEWESHAHDQHELVWVRGGTMTTRVGDRVFTVSEGSGLWLPAGAEHAGRLTAGVEFFDAFFAPDRTPVTFDGPTVIAMSPLLESLLTHLARTDLDTGSRARAEAVVFDVLDPAEEPLALRVPGDPRIDAIAEALLADPADGRGLEEWARELEVSERTITRAFRQSTGLSFVQWRQSLRVHHALALLAEGWDVQATSERLGYAQASTFIAAFRRVMGTTPGAYTGSS
ncbi:helix-turn-helix domain-containing protein [Leifsonia sp. NPDC058194]|uniref:helix-turn-helix domain-containing protein n=1 Tax=Leifsonia sp. NPDC058194 TaxID=3346374 RepID=UPI0036D79E84